MGAIIRGWLPILIWGEISKKLIFHFAVYSSIFSGIDRPQKFCCFLPFLSVTPSFLFQYLISLFLFHLPPLLFLNTSSLSGFPSSIIFSLSALENQLIFNHFSCTHTIGRQNARRQCGRNQYPCKRGSWTSAFHRCSLLYLVEDLLGIYTPARRGHTGPGSNCRLRPDLRRFPYICKLAKSLSYGIC